MTQNSTLPTYSVIYAFGDSLSDAGNLSISTSLAGLTTPVSPPYYTPFKPRSENPWAK